MAIGETKTVTISMANKIALVLFDGAAGQRISVGTNATNCCREVTIINPNGTALANVFIGSGSGFIDTRTLPATGTYTILIDPSGSITGSITLTLYNVPPDVTGTIAIDGPPVTVTTTVPGQNASLTFSGAAGQRISLVTNSTNCCRDVTIINPDGTALVNVFIGSGGGFIDTRTLPATGAYTILIDPSGSITGSITLTLYNVPPDVTGTIAIGGPAVPITITTPGQNAGPTFSGTTGQQVTVRVTGNTICVVTVRLLRPDGTSLTSSTSCSGSFNLTTQTLPTTGTYTINIDPNGASTGSLNVSLTSP
jgi:hypothetical protein